MLCIRNTLRTKCYKKAKNKGEKMQTSGSQGYPDIRQCGGHIRKHQMRQNTFINVERYNSE